MLRKIVSGGQSGADRAGLDFAISTGLEHGGFVPRGRKAEDGREEEPERLLAILAKLAPLTGYLIRREANWHDPAAEAEIESDIFVKVRRALVRFLPGYSVYSYLRTVIHYTIIGYLG